MSSARPLLAALRRLPTLVVHAASLAVVGLVLVSAGQPIFTDDAWWHLAMGRVYATSGPWLAADPFLFAAPGPPAPAAWLSDMAFHLVHRVAGFQGLRVAHVLLVALTIALAWSMLRRASGSRVFASLGSAIFTLLSAYRLFQLRPHLFSIGACLLLMHLLVTNGLPPSRRRLAAATALLALWANVHGAFVLGPVLLSSAIAGVVAGALLWPAQMAESWQRARRLGLALGLGLLGTLLNPAGLGLHGLYFAAGAETPDLSVVADEWARVALFQLPLSNLPPTPLNWAIVWGLLLATPLAIGISLASRRRAAGSPSATPVDPALIAVAAASLVGMLSAVRLLWLGLFPLLLIGASLREQAALRGRHGRPLVWATAGALLAVGLVPGFLGRGDWSMISQGLQPAGYTRPYSATKNYAHAVWFLRDAGLEGRLFNDYSSGNFLSYWATPRLQVFINGSLNVPIEVAEAARAIATRSGLAPDRTFLELLDRHRVDLFFGVGAPWVSLPGRPVIPTTTHLEHAPGWIMVFRNMRSAVYVRDAPRGRANLRRVADYYEAAGVPFDPERGFDPWRVMSESLEWAVGHGLLPTGIEQIEAASRSIVPRARRQALGQLASIYAVAGAYDRAVAIDRRLLQRDPQSVRPARRLVWSLLHQRRIAESAEAAEHLARIASPRDGISRRLVDAARRGASNSEDEIAAVVAMLPVLDRPEGHRVFAGYREPETRPDRR